MHNEYGHLVQSTVFRTLTHSKHWKYENRHFIFYQYPDNPYAALVDVQSKIIPSHVNYDQGYEIGYSYVPSCQHHLNTYAINLQTARPLTL